MTTSLNDLSLTAVHISYYFICHRKLWLFSHSIQMEHTSESVELGALIHEFSYKRNRKEIQLGPLKIDFFEKNKGLIHEVKKSKAMEDSHVWQLKYYLYYLKKKEIYVAGQLDYPLIRKTQRVDLTDEDEKEMEKIIFKINEIRKLDIPPSTINKKICRKCSYFELCYV